MQLKNTLPLQDLRMARDSNANWYSVLSKPATVVLEYLSLPAQHLKCRNLRLSENSSNVLQIFTTNAQEWIQWNIVNVFQPKCENMCHRDVNKFESICPFFSSWNLQWCTKCRGIFTKIFGLTEGWFWFNLLCLMSNHRDASLSSLCIQTSSVSLCIHCTTLYILTSDLLWRKTNI